MSSTNMYMTQTEWDRLNKSLCSIFDIEYHPSISSHYTISEETANGGFNIGRNINAKNWLITKPNGETVATDNLAAFCRDYNLVENKMRRVSKKLSGRKTYHGYSVDIL